MRKSFWLSVDGFMSTFIILLFVFQITDILILTGGAHGGFTQREMNDNLCISGFILVLTCMKAVLAQRLKPSGEYFLLTVGTLTFTIWLSLANLAELAPVGSSFLADGERMMQRFGLLSAFAVVALQLALIVFAQRRKSSQSVSSEAVRSN